MRVDSSSELAQGIEDGAQGRAIADIDGHSKLPRGPHALPQDVVFAHQRRRLLDAAAAAMGERGYAELTVRDLIERAGVSRRTFYQLFEDKLDCVLAAHERAFDRLSEAIVGACRSRADWADKASAAICAALELAVKEPSDARLIVASCHPAAEPKLAECGRLAQQRLATLLRAGRKQVADPDAPLDLTEQALIGAVMAIVGERLQSDGGSALLALRPELVQIILTPYLGGRAAHQVARRSGG